MNIKTAGTKYDSDKSPFELIPIEAMQMMSDALKYGAKKYGAHNFKGGLEQTRLAASNLRHVYEYLSGQNLDPESGVHVIGHALASLAMLAYTIKNRPDLDDRYKKDITTTNLHTSDNSNVDKP